MTGLIDTFAPGLFAGKAVLVTGGTSGIGLGAALAFHTLGATVTATGATDAECERARTDGANAPIAFKRLDVRDGAACAILIGSLPELDIVVNAAGAIRRDAEHDIEVFADVIDINLTGTMRVCTAARAKLARSSPSSAAHASPPTALPKAASVSSRRASPPPGPPTACGSTPSPRAGSPRR